MSPLLPADVIAVDSVHVVIICPICGKFHWHGSNGITTDLNYGTRVPHCTGDDAGRFRGQYELITSEHTVRRKKLRPRDIEAWRDIQRSKRADLEDQWRAQEEAEKRRPDTFGGEVNSCPRRQVSTLEDSSTGERGPYPRHRVDESTWHLLRQRAVPGHFQIAGWPGAEQDFWMMILMNRLEQLRAKRLELIKNIAVTADQIAALDCEIEAIQMNLLEEDLNRQQEAVA
jgi:hypothetical protein